MWWLVGTISISAAASIATMNWSTFSALLFGAFVVSAYNAALLSIESKISQLARNRQ